MARGFLQGAGSEGRSSAPGRLWAALESLLVAPGDTGKLPAAERAADIAVLALVRQNHLTALGAVRKPSRGDAAFAASLSALPREQHLPAVCAYLAGGVFSGVTSPEVRNHLQHTATLRLPDELGRVHRDVLSTLKGLYRQRNLVLHGGVTDAPLRDELLRASGPLVASVLHRCSRGGPGGARGPQLLAFDDGVRLERYLEAPTDVAEIVC